MNCRNSSTPTHRTWGWIKAGLFGAALALFGTVQAQTITVGTGTSTSTAGTNGDPIYRSSASSSFNFSKSIHLYRQADLAALPAGSTITAFAFNKANTGTMSSGRNATMTVYMKNSTATALASGTAWNTMISGATTAFNGTTVVPPGTSGYWTLSLGTPFVYTGGAIEVYVDWAINGTGASPTTAGFTWQYTSTAAIQDMGTSNSVAIPGTTTSWTTNSRMYNAQFTYTPPPACTDANGSISGSAAACFGTSNVLSIGGPLVSGLTYQWRYGPVGGPYSTNLGTASTQNTSAIPVGNWEVVADITCQNCGPCSATTAPFAFQSKAVPTASASSNSPVCVGQPLNLTGSSDIGTSFNWTGPASFTSSLQSPQVSASATAAMAGTYVLTASLNGCTSAASNAVVSILASPTISSVTATPNPTCFNGNSQLNVSAAANTDYSVTSIPYAPIAGSGTSITAWAGGGDLGVDDGFSTSPVAIPFSFVFNGVSYNQFWVSTNGYLTFLNPSGVSAANSRASTNMNSNTTPNGVIALSFADLHMLTPGVVSYFSTGSPGSQIMVLDFNAVPFYNASTGTGNVTGQILLYEGTNMIEVHVGSVNHGTSTSVNALGIENGAGTSRVFAPGRSPAALWNVTTSEAWRFAPASLTYQWTPGTFLSATNIANPMANGINVASEAYTVTVTNNNNCSTTGNVTVTTASPITAATITGNLAYCAGGSTTLTAVPTDGAGPYTYLWSPGGQTTAAISVNAPGSYSAQVSDNCGGSVNTGSVSVTENALPIVGVTPTSASFCTGNAAVALTADGASTYSWAPATGLSATTGASVNASPAATTTYTVTGTDGNGCINTATSTITNAGTAPTIASTTATPSTICPGGSSQLQVNLASTPYCSTIAFTNLEAISNVTFANINNSSPCAIGAASGGSLQDFTSVVGNVTAGSTYPMSVTGTTDGNFSTYITAFFDWDQNGSFETVQQVGVITNTACVATANTNITVPATALNGNTRMRIVKDYSGTVNIYPLNPCATYDFGQAEDYTINVSGGMSLSYLWDNASSLNDATIPNPIATPTGGPVTGYTVAVTMGSCTSSSLVQVTVATVDDGDPCTADVCTNGVVTHTFQDADADGICDANDPCPNLANLQNGDPCDDGNACTTGDIVSGCVCAGTVQDTDSDGICDANDNCPTVPGVQGSACDDGNPLTTGDALNASCVCAGLAVDCEGTPSGPAVPGTSCDDGNVCTINDTWSASCVCVGTIQDTDNDGLCDANDNCPSVPGVQGDACNDSNPCTINDVLNASCVCEGTPAPVTAGITASQPSYCTPGPGVVLTASGGDTYSWAPAAGLSATTGSPVTATPSSATTYTVTATNAAGCSDTETVTVGVGSTPAAPTASANPTTTCPGGDAQLNVAGAVPALVVTISGTGFMDEVGWTLTNAASAVVGSGGPYGSGSTNVHPIANPGLSPFVLFVETQGSFNDNAITYSVTCGGSTILSGSLAGGQTFTSAPVGCSATYSYSWSPSTYLTSSTIANPIAQDVMATTTYTATATTPAGCSASTTVTVTVDPNAVPTFTGPTADPNPACPGGDSQLSVSTGNFTYCIPSLSFGCSFPDAIQNVNVAGIVRASGCDNTSGSNGYSLFSAPQGALVAGSTGNSYSVTTGGDTEGATIWIDYNHDGVFGAGEQLFNSYAGTNPATYSGTFSVPAGAVNGPTRLRVRCTYAQAPGTDACGGTQTTYGETEDYTVIISGGIDQFTYSWSPSTYLSATNIANPMATNVTAPETYTVTVTNAAGCSATGTVTLNVETTDTDGDGTVDCNDGCPTDMNKVEPGQCGCGVADTDTDGDLTADCIDGCPTDANKTEPGICGCGVADTDSDGDLTADCNDLCPLDPNKIAPGVCGCGVADTDGDGDGIADCNDLCPSVPGTVGTPCNDGNANTINDVLNSSCVCEGTIPVCAFNTVLLDLVTDNDGAQTSWDVVNQGTTTVVCSGSGYLNNQTVTLACCLPNGCYELRVFDSAGDGMANGTVGGYVLRSNGTGNRRMIDNSGDGIFTSVSQIAANQGFCVPMGNDVVIAAHCDKTNWLPNDVIQATANPAVTGQFGLTNSTSGYQFWFFNPDGGYSRRVTQTHAAPGGVSGPPANVRSSYLRLSSLVTQPIPFFTNLNVRVRTQVAGVFSEFGPACRFRLDPPCTTTQLTPVADPVVSCGATGLSLSSTIYATPVAGANVYQFEFSKAGYLRRIAHPVRSTALNFVTNPLQNNNCYQVRVRISFDGGNTFCPFGPSCNIVIGTALCGSAMPMAPDEVISEVAQADLTIWPNPNDGSLVNVSLTEFDATVNTVLVEVTDIYGKLVSSRTLAVQDGYLRTTLAFEQDLAPGLYLVNLQAGEARYTERLVIQ